MRIPAASARSAARRITGPSASGSENGKPISTRSAPPATAAAASSGVVRAGHQVDDERLAHLRCASASSRSLSPRPERQTTITSPSSSAARASAWDGLERRDDPLGLGEPAERLERLLVGRGQVLGAARVAQERVLGPDARVVEPGGDRVRVGDLAVLVGEQRRARAVEHARAGRCRGSPRPRPRRRRAARRRRRGSRRTSRSRSSRRRRRRSPRRAAGPRPRAPARAPRARSPPGARGRSPGTAPGRRTSRSGSASSRRS